MRHDRRKLWLGVLVSALTAATLVWAEPDATPKTLKKANGRLAAKPMAKFTPDKMIVELDKLLAEEEALLQAFEEIKKDMQIVKVRAASQPIRTVEVCP